MKKKIKELAKKYGFHDVKYAGRWKDREVYEPIFLDDEDHCIGYPQYILCKNGKLCWVRDWKESIEIMGELGG